MILTLLTIVVTSAAEQRYFQGIELLSDANYTQGFDVIPACPDDPTGCAMAPRYRLYNPFSTVPNTTATWQLAQWNSHSNLTTNGSFVDDGKSRGMRWFNDDKGFVLFQDTRLQMSIDGFHEYRGQYKKPGNAWPALLAQQTIQIAGGSIALDQLNELRWNIDVQLLYMDQHIQPGYNPDIHAAIFPLYLAIQNLVQGDPEYGKYFWLGICLYDDRVPMSPLYVNGDKGTGALIYQPAFANFANSSVHSGSIVHVTGDMIPFVRLGLQAAVERGYLNSTDLHKYYVGGMNVGWEVTGLNNGTIEIGNFSLKQYTPQNPKSYEFNRDGDAEGWTSSLASNGRGPVNGKWILVWKGNDHRLISPTLRIDASVVKKIIVKTVIDGLSSHYLQLRWSTEAEEVFDERNSQGMEVKNDGLWREFVFDMSNDHRWNGIVRRLQIHAVHRSNRNREWGVDYIRFAPGR